MILTPQKALNKAYRKQSINKDSLEVFKSQLQVLIDSVNSESEENHKNDFIQFLNYTFYKGKYYLNTKERIDLVNKILEIKKADPQADTTELEQEIDLLVYKLYDLTYDEVLIVAPETSISREVYGE